MTTFTINDAFVKLLGDHIPFFQLLFVRGLAVVAIMAVMAWRAGAFSMPIPKKDRKLILIRSASETAAAYFFLTALFKMPIANVTAILQALPLTVSLGAMLIFGENVGWRRFVAIGVGFAGVMLIVQPGGDVFSIYSVYALAAVVCVTIRDLAARRLSSEVPSMTVAISAAVGILVFASVGATFTDWVPMTTLDIAFLAGAVVSVIAAYLFAVMAMRVGDIGFVAPFRYTSLLAALFLGLIVFDEWPDSLTMIGAVIVVATGVYTLWRERATQTAATGEESA